MQGSADTDMNLKLYLLVIPAFSPLTSVYINDQAVKIYRYIPTSSEKNALRLLVSCIRKVHLMYMNLLHSFHRITRNVARFVPYLQNVVTDVL